MAKPLNKAPKIVFEESESSTFTARLFHIARTMLLTLVFTMFVAAVFHLLLVFVVAIFRNQLDLINPIEFLGLATIFPGLVNSKTALLVGWLVLVVLYWIIYRVLMGLEDIVAFWYTTDTYDRYETGKSEAAKRIKELKSTIMPGYRVNHLRSIYYLTKRRK